MNSLNKLDVDEIETYIAGFPDQTQGLLNQIRKIILEAAPGVSEQMAYGMPAYKLRGKPLVYFGGYKHHIGFYATPTGHEQFIDELSGYKQGKGSVQFPLDQPMPWDLIERMVKFRVSEVNTLKIKGKPGRGE
jgi:uncharacterized protein YdhG (YjbR/CyaY superfamily)